MKLCEYGCGLEALYQFKNGKWCCSENCRTCLGVRKKNSKSHTGLTQSEETRKKLSEANKGQIPWNKGKNTGPRSEETKKKIGEGNKGQIPWNKGIPRSEETKKKLSKSMQGKNTEPKSEETKKKISKGNKGKKKLTIKKINKQYPIFSKIEEMRYNPVKPNKKEIQVHCKNHNCKNSKEKGGWFTPKNKYAFLNRIYAVEKPDGNDGYYFYCCQECKDVCILYNLHNDPFDETENDLPYTHSEWSETRGRAWERDNGLCRDCGKPGTEVHHIKPVKLEPFLALDIDNLITLCENCHKKYHKQGLKNSTGNLANITCSPESQKFLNQKQENIE